MPRKKTVTETVEFEEPGPPEAALPPDEQPPNVDEQALQLAIAELGLDTGTVRIVAYRLRPNRDPEECSDCPFDQFNKNDLRDQFGPGDYMLQLRSKGLLRRKYTLHFASPVTVSALAAPVLPAADGTLAGLSAQLRGSLAELQAAHSAQMIDLLKTLLTRDAGPRADPVTIGSAWLDQAIKLQALIGRRGEGDDLDRLAKLLEISRTLGGVDGKGATGADVALELMRMTKPVLELARVSVAAEGRALTGSSTSKDKDPAMPTPLLRTGLQLLVRNAAADNDPRTYAEMLVDNVPHQQLAAFLTGPAWFDQLCLFEPAAGEHSVWFEELREEVLALIQPPAPDPGLTALAVEPDTAAESEGPHVPSEPAAAGDTGAPAVRRGGNARHVAANARPGAAVQGSPAADRARARPGARAPAKGHGRSD